MRRLLGFLFEVLHLVAGPFARLDSLTMKFRAAPRWGNLVLGRTIHPTVVCGETRRVRLGNRSSVGCHVVLELGMDRTGHDRQPEIQIGDGSSVGANTVFCAYGAVIQIDANTHIGSNCHFGAYGAGIVIGKNCLIASHCSMVDTQHIFEDSTVPIIVQGFTSKGIVIKDNAWLGAGVVLMDGVTVGEGAVIGAGSVVTKNIPPGVIAVGVPARVVRYRSGDTIVTPSGALERFATQL